MATPKCQTPKCQNPKMSKTQNVKTLKCQSPKMSKPKISKRQNVKTPTCQNTKMSKRQNVKTPNVKSPTCNRRYYTSVQVVPANDENVTFWYKTCKVYNVNIDWNKITANSTDVWRNGRCSYALYIVSVRNILSIVLVGVRNAVACV